MESDPAYILGWFAAFVGMIGFGSFAVPIKGEAANSVDIDPLVMQSYKSLMCFLTSWLVILLGQEVSFTWWGLVSGLFWVPGGAFNIFAIRNAGLAISQGIVSSSIVMVSFIWGNLIFHEPVESQIIAYSAVWLIMAGLYGMSHYSTAEPMSSQTSNVSDTEEERDEEQTHDLMRKNSDSFENDSTLSQPLEITQPLRRGRSILICGKTYSRQNLGLLSALMCGLWGGSCLVPMHYAKGDTNGLGYVISFSIGALVVTVFLWILRYLYQVFKLRSPRRAYEVLPPFHFRVMWLPGATAGSLWSLGNVGSIVAVEHLGQGVGYSASQLALLVSGMWGIFYFKEVSKPSIIGKWFLSAFVTIAGILLLGYESSPSGPGRR
mmetsp:Transcript_15396/g.32577  ORF Transcript_15396/g.32577 Transcript_15396/m.32577 type:complete len:378 (-) Transcript_15396:180-1313(-)|eukprot:CAMPEP_0183711860 /NCGR_PEP_ID=MMETSP0737-20130205/7220_1 /TAXON_ID=385413 /ORGANISM="Thalassiosira miniscula, Strain CCMP1093" /LENGTH=377 /DNA_ID=CAMNT_0025940427 /DNA_START=102 /DNA_END=1235 /DNA_ORIENTATION=+